MMWELVGSLKESMVQVSGNKPHTMKATIIISMMLKMLQVSYFLSPEYTSGSPVTLLNGLKNQNRLQM